MVAACSCPGPMRLFVAVEMNPAVQRRGGLIERCARARRGWRRDVAITWVTAERLHVTVRSSARRCGSADAIRRPLAPPLASDGPFDLTLRALARFRQGEAAPCRLGGLDRWTRLAAGDRARGQRAAGACRVVAEERPYRRISRWRASARPAALGRRLAGAVADGARATTVDAITLFESRLSPKGPDASAAVGSPAPANQRPARDRQILEHRCRRSASATWGRSRSRSCCRGGVASICAGRQRKCRGVERAADERGGAAVLAMVLDAVKGTVAVLMAERLPRAAAPVAAGLASVIGHVYPVWLRFRGGKGVATAAGAFACWRRPALAAAAVFALLVVATRFISVGSMAAALTLPVGRSQRWTRRVWWRGGARVAAAIIVYSAPRQSGAAGRARTERQRGRRLISVRFVRSRRGGLGNDARRSTWRVGHDAWLWARDAALVADMQSRRANAVYLPTSAFRQVSRSPPISKRRCRQRRRRVRGALARDARAFLRRAAPYIRPGSRCRQRDEGARAGHVVSCRRSSSRSWGTGIRVAVLSGPSFAAEVARELPTAVSSRSTRDPDVVERVQAEFQAPTSGSTAPTTSLAWRSAARSRTSSPSPPASSKVWAWATTRARRADHARAGRDVAPGLRGRRQARNAGRADRPRRSGADLHRTLSRNRHVGIELAQGPRVAGRARRHEDGGRGRADDRGGAGAGRAYGVELPIAAQVAELLAGRKDAGRRWRIDGAAAAGGGWISGYPHGCNSSGQWFGGRWDWGCWGFGS